MDNGDDMKIIFPDYEKSLINVTNSILKYFDVETIHNTMAILDEELEKGKYQNVLMILYDGMGYHLLRRNLDRNMFLNRHLKVSISAPFPPTTTASTTSVLSGLTPKEHGWLGWNLYFKELGETVTLFLNIKKDTDIMISEENVASKYYPYTNIIEKINQTYKAYSIMPFGNDAFHSLEEMNEKIKKYCKEDGKKFIYAYCDYLDAMMHQFGTDSKRTRMEFQKINDSTKKLCDSLENTLVIVVADHGHLNCDSITLSEYPDIFSLLDHDISIEGRACAFFIKEGKQKHFETLFHQYFGEYFKLYTKEEIIESNIFGIGKEHPRFQETLGDYVAIAISNKYFRYNENSDNYLSMHAGLTEDEMVVPLILYKAK